MKDGIDNVVGAVGIIELIANNSFEKWFSTNYSNSMSKRAFFGYKFYVMTALRVLASSLIMNSSFKFTRSYQFYRANFVGKKIDEFWDNCELYSLIREINSWDEKVCNSNTYAQLQTIVKNFNNSFCKPFKKIFSQTKKIKKDLNKLLLAESTFVYFNDTNGVFPNTYRASMIPLRINKSEHKRALFGYAHTNLFIWELILGKTEVPEKLQNIVNSKIWVDSESIFLDERTSKIKKLEFDSFFGVISENVSKKLNLDIMKDFVFLKKNYSKESLKQIFNKKFKKPTESKSDELNKKLYWHSVELLGHSEQEVYLGIPTFELILRGAINFNMDLENPDPVKLIRIKHPKEKNQNHYSYGILVERYGAIADYSGWLISYNCATDYSGFGGSNFRRAEELIKQFLVNKLVEVNDITISLKIFEKEFPYKFGKELNFENIDETTETNLPKLDEGQLKGLTLELLGYYIESKKKEFAEVIWSEGSKGDRDIVCINNNHVKLIECKLNPNNWNIEEELDKLKEKAKLYSGKKVDIEFLFYYPPPPITEEFLWNKKIKFECLKESKNLRQHIGIRKTGNIRQLIERTKD